MAKVNEAKRCVGQYEIRETLGKGGYSWVKKGIDTKSGKTVALKFMTRAEKSWEKEQAKQVRTEIKSLIGIKCKNVMRLLAYNLNCKYPQKDGELLDTILLVLEFCPGGELFDILYYTQQLDDITARTYFIQMMIGIKACHDAGIVHRDLKPQNLLMDSMFQLKLTDFGLSILVKDKNTDKAVMTTHYVGTRGYQAPELLKKKKYGKSCDIFSAGVVLFILLTGYPPFEQAVKEDKWYHPISVNNPAKFWTQHSGCGVKPDAQKLITHMLAYHPSTRISIDQILESEFCKGKIHTPKELYQVLRKKHRATSERRKKDKKKMNEMEHSMKKRDQDVLKETAAHLSSVPCPVKEYEPRHSLMTKRWIVRPKYNTENKSEGEQKEEKCSVPLEVVHAYLVAWQALECKGKTDVKPLKNSPWDVRCVATDNFELKYTIEMNINRDKNGVYYFNFKRISGEALNFHKIWKNCEAFFIHSKYFTDEADEYDEIPQEDVKGDLLFQMENDEKQEKKVDDDGKHEE